MTLKATFTTDARSILAEIGDPVRSGALTGYGLLREELVEVSGGGGYPGTLARALTLSVVGADFPLSVGDTVEVERTTGTWTTYRVRNRTTPPEGGAASGTLERFMVEEA